MNSKPREIQRRSTLYFASLEFLVILLPCLFVVDDRRGTGLFGSWAFWILVAALAALLVMSLAYLSRRRSLAISGLVVCALVTAAGFILPFVFPPPTKANHAEQVRSTGTAAACFGFGRTGYSGTGFAAGAHSRRRSVSSGR